MESLSAVWQQAMEAMQQHVSKPSYEMYFRSIRPLTYDRGRVVVEVPNATIKEHMEGRHAEMLRRTLEKILAERVSIELVVSDRTAAPPAAPPEPRRLLAGSVLNPRYTFASFVVGRSNQLAHAAARAVASAPGKSYNPLFIYGGVGLGKTHLMQAIGHAVHSQEPATRVVYVTTERFTNEVIHAIQTQTMPEVHRRYRTADVLLVDDVQFLINKERTQEEFFHTFNSLYEIGKQIVISSDRPPRELDQLQERLTSRFKCGLTADIKPPDIETRMAILLAKAASDKVEVPHEVLSYIADRITHNIRDLEGALTRVIAEAHVRKSPPSIPLAERVINEILPHDGQTLTVERITEATCSLFRLSPQQLASSSRAKEVTLARQVAMYLCRRYTKAPLTSIGRSFGNRDHSTVIHACEKIEEMVKQDPYLKQQVEKLCQEMGITWEPS